MWCGIFMYDGRQRFCTRGFSRCRSGERWQILVKGQSYVTWNRRAFLKAGAALGVSSRLSRRLSPSRTRTHLPAVRTVHDLSGDRLVHRFRDLYSSPTTQNEYGYVQAAKSVSGITALSLPPFGCCGVPDTPWSPGFLLSCELLLNGRILISYPDGGDEIAYQWHPHRIVRETRADGLKFTTETFMPAKRRAVAESIRVTNLAATPRRIKLGFDMRAAVAKKTTQWITYSPGEADNSIHWDDTRGCLIFEAQHSAAVSVQGISPKVSGIDSGRMLVVEMELGRGQTRELHYVNAVDADAKAALAAYDDLQANFTQVKQQTQNSFTSLL